MLTLVFPNTSLTSASIPVRWCIDAESFSNLELTELRPFILLEVNYERGYNPSFHLFPLDQYSAYLDIHYPGKITIKGHLMVADGNHKEAFRKLFMTHSYDRQHVYPDSSYLTCLSVHGNPTYVNVHTFECSPDYDFEIDESLFGKELPEWIKFFINRYWYREKPKDQCDQRRRLILFPFTTLSIIILEFLFRLIWNFCGTAACWVIGAHPGFKYILHPFNGWIDKYGIDHSTHIFTKLSKTKWMEEHNSILVYAFTVPFIPIVYITMYSISIMFDYDPITAIFAAFGIYWWICVIVLAIVGIMVGVIFGTKYLVNKILGPNAKIVSRWVGTKVNKLIFCILSAYDKFIDWLDNLLSDDIEHQKELLLCHSKDGECLPKLTTRDKSIPLIFADIKQKVCKPMRG